MTNPEFLPEMAGKVESKNRKNLKAKKVTQPEKRFSGFSIKSDIFYVKKNHAKMWGHRHERRPARPEIDP